MGVHNKHIRFDWAIKRLLRQTENFDILEGFLTVFLGEKIEIVEILKSKGPRQKENEKFNRADIKVRNSKGETNIVEIQNTTLLHYCESRLLAEADDKSADFNIGDNAEDIKGVYFINVLHFDIGQGADYVYKGKDHLLGLHTNIELRLFDHQRNTLLRSFPKELNATYYLIRTRNFNLQVVSPMEEWMLYLSKGVISESTQTPGLKEAYAKLKCDDMSKAEKYAYFEYLNAVMIQNDVLGNARREGLAIGEAMAEGWAEGRAEAQAENRKKLLESARSMLADGLSVDKVVVYTGLSEDEVKGLVR